MVRGIFSSAKGAIDLTDQQLQAEIGKLFAEEAKLVIYPTSRFVKIKAGEVDGIGIGIKNIANDANAPTDFSYEVLIKENDCGLTDEQIGDWISLGKSEEGIPIPISDFGMGRVTFRIPDGTPNCLARFRVAVERGEAAYASDLFEVEVRA